MENSESEYNRRDGASRPPRGATSYGAEGPVFTEISADSLHRTPVGERSTASTFYNNSTNTQRTAGSTDPRQTAGRTPQSMSRPVTDAGRSAPRGTTYTPQSRSYTEPRRAAPQQTGSVRRSSPEFTEISWDSFRSGNMSAPAEPQRAAQAPSYAQPYVDLTTAQPYAQQPRSSSPANAPRDSRRSYAVGGAQRHAAQAPEYEQPDPLYGSVPQREVPAQHPHGDYYCSGAIHRPAQRTSSARPAAQRPAPQRTPSGGGGSRPPQTPNGGGRRPPRRPRIKLRYHPAVYIGVLALVVLLVFGIFKLVQKSNEKPLYSLPSYAPVTETPKPTSTPAPEETPETTEEEATASPRPTAEPTPTPTGAKAQRKGTLIVPADWGAVVPERTSAVFDSHFDRSVMIGNSLVEGFFMWSGMKNIRYIYSTGAVVNNVIGNLDLSPLTLNESTYYTDIYLMFGLNEVGTDVNSFIQSYKKLVEYIREYQTEANIYIISVTPVTQEVDADPEEVQSMDRIDSFNAALKQFCVDENCWYLDIYSMLLDDTGYLSADYAYSGDGKHFEKSGYVAWANYMKTHFVDEGLLTE